MKPIGFYNYTVIATYLGLCFAGAGCFLASEGNLKAALICLLIAGATDMVDGKIASTRKRTQDEKQFGIQIDSLCDLVSFTVLPAMLMLSMQVPSLLKTVSGVAIILAGVIRLGYFNVTEQNRQAQTAGRRKTYEGLPVTSVAATLPLLCLFHGVIPEAAFGTVYAIALLLHAVLFLSPFRLRKPHGTTLLAFAFIGTIEFFCILLLL